MIPKTSFKEFEKDFRQLTGDSIKKLVMAKIVETPAYVVKELGLEFPPGQSLLWGLLIFGQQGIHFFALDGSIKLPKFAFNIFKKYVVSFYNVADYFERNYMGDK